MFVRNHMQSDVITIPPTASVEDALYIMRENQIQQLPILDFDGRLLGMVTDRDLLLVSPSPTAALTIHEMMFALSNLKVSEIMPEETLTVDPGAPLEEAARIMIDNKLDALPVVDETGLIGLITERDVFRTFVEYLRTDQPAVEITILMPYVLGTIAYLCRLIAEAGGSILNIGTFSGRGEDTFTVSVKIGDIPISRAREIVERAESEKGCQLLDMRETETGPSARE